MMSKKATARKKKADAGDTTVEDIMVCDVVTIESSASLTDAARTMKGANVGMLPVIDDGRLRGVITDRDIVVRGIAHAADVSTTRVGECLSVDVVAARPAWTTEQAMKAMAEAQVGRLPVLDDDGRLVGVVTLSSLAYRAPEKAETLETAQEVSRRSARETAA